MVYWVCCAPQESSCEGAAIAPVQQAVCADAPQPVNGCSEGLLGQRGFMHMDHVDVLVRMQL